MSALGQKRTYAVQKGMSALPPIATAKADMYPANGHVCFIFENGHSDPPKDRSRSELIKLAADDRALPCARQCFRHA